MKKVLIIYSLLFLLLTGGQQCTAMSLKFDLNFDGVIGDTEHVLTNGQLIKIGIWLDEYDPDNPDSDGDGLLDGEEKDGHTLPFNRAALNYPDVGDIDDNEWNDIERCIEKVRKILKKITGIDFKIEVEYCLNTDERAVGVEPDVVDDETAELINGLTVRCGEVEIEVTAEFPPDYTPPSLK